MEKMGKKGSVSRLSLAIFMILAATGLVVSEIPDSLLGPIATAMGVQNDERDTKMYFAYGSNMDTSQMGERCLTASLQGLARLQGFKFVINGRGVASIVESPNDAVEGVLWEISSYDERALDWYEGVAGGYYTKNTFLVEDRASGDMVEALVYIGTDTDLGEARPGYLERIIEAAQYHKLSTICLEELVTWKCRLGSP